MNKMDSSFSKVREIMLNITQGELDTEKMVGDEELDLYGLDSLKFIKLIIEIEQAFNIEIEDNMFVFGNFNTINKILSYIEKREFKGNDKVGKSASY